MDQPVLPPPQPTDLVLAALRAALHEATSHQRALPVTELTASLLAHELIARGVEFPGESRRTRGGRPPRTQRPGAWAPGTLPPPPSATDGPSVVHTPRGQS